MVNGKKVIVILPAYNAARTLRQTYHEIPQDVVDDIILTDDLSTDDTLLVAADLGIHHILKHDRNSGYGANQKTCYTKALELGADVIIMLHPDYQYTPKLIPSMAHIVASGIYPVVLGSRILGGRAIKGGMPVYKYVSNRILTLFQNLMTGAKLSEYHTGYRAFSADVLRKINFASNSDDFIFDNELLSQIIYAGFEIGEITCPAKYFEEASSINFYRSVKYGKGVVVISLKHFLQRHKIWNFKLYRQPLERGQGVIGTTSTARME
jgi:glycosyltransferase involved in cell wall biosynthesis